MLNNLLDFLGNRFLRLNGPRRSDITAATSVIPHEFRFSHDYCVFLNDVLTDIVVSGEQARLFDVTVHFDTVEEGTALSAVNQEDILEWLEEHDYVSHAQDVIFRIVLVALLSDFCHFIFEALRNSSKGKLTVAFTLLRKPLKESLLAFEWLLADRAGFLHAFTHNWPAQYNDLLREQVVAVHG